MLRYMRMKINLSQSDLEKLYVLLDNKEINISIAEVLFSIYEEKEFFRGCQTQEEFFQKLLEFIGVPPSEKEDIRIFEKWVKPAIFPLKVPSFLKNPYFGCVVPNTKKIGKYALEYLSYKQGQPLPLNDIEVDSKDGYIERTPIGFLDGNLQYLSLSYEGVTWMCITPNEINTMQPHINSASGKVLVFGLGLGYYPYMVSLKDEVKDIYIIELDQNIINIFKENILPFFPHQEKIHLIHADAKEYIKTIDNSFNTIFIDLWHNAQDGLPLYLYFKQFEKKYPNSHFQYWLENSLIALYRRYLLTLIEEALDGYTEKDYQHAKNDDDKFINRLYQITKNITLNTYDDVYQLLSKESILRLL